MCDLQDMNIKVIDNHWNMTPNKSLSVAIAKRHLAEFVYDAVKLEGINFTLPEIQTLIDGVTIGGHTLADQQIAINQSNAWRVLFELISTGKFSLSAKVTCKLHAVAGKEESLEFGCFRSGNVTIAGTDYMPPEAVVLPSLFEKMINDAYQIEDIYDRAIHTFLTIARCQFFYDVNKRIGRLIMNGILLNHGYPAINVLAKRQLEFNQLMLDYYSSNNQNPMNKFLRSCLDKRIVKIVKESVSNGQNKKPTLS